MLKSISIAAALVVASIGTAQADDYLNTQGVIAGQLAGNATVVMYLNDVDQDATNVGNSYEVIDNDHYNDDYRSHQTAFVAQGAGNLALVKYVDDVTQNATNVGNVLNIEDHDGKYYMGDQDVHTGQFVVGVQGALNVAAWKRADDVDQTALNVGNQVTLEFDHPDGNIIDVKNHQHAALLQGSANIAVGKSAGDITQSATNVGNSFSAVH